MPPGISTTSSSITMANRWDHFLARSAIRRTGHLVQPGRANGRFTSGTPRTPPGQVHDRALQAVDPMTAFCYRSA